MTKCFQFDIGIEEMPCLCIMANTLKYFVTQFFVLFSERTVLFELVRKLIPSFYKFDNKRKHNMLLHDLNLYMGKYVLKVQKFPFGFKKSID